MAGHLDTVGVAAAPSFVRSASGQRSSCSALHGSPDISGVRMCSADIISTMDNKRATAVMEAMVAMFASGDPSEASASVDEAYLDHQGLGAGPLHGVDGFAFVVRANFASYRHLEVRIEDLFASGDRVAARITWVGRRSNGEHTTRKTIDILRVSGGRAIEHWGAAV
ncbi:MAG: ester cyclase [Acidimicrobiaceae bacterium]|nr:ester cyclase [Acidimicrobiaceae bacterium]